MSGPPGPLLPPPGVSCNQGTAIRSTCSDTHTQTLQTMQGNKVLTGNIIILTHDRPIHKTNSGYLGRLGEQWPGDSSQAACSWAPEEVGAAGEGRGEGQCALAALTLGSEVICQKEQKLSFFKKHESQSTMASLPCHKSSVAKTPLNTVVFCKSAAMSVWKVLPSPEACVSISPCLAKQACRKRFCSKTLFRLGKAAWSICQASDGQASYCI